MSLEVCAAVAGEAMSVLVVGSVAYDSVETLAGSRDEALGGSATFFSISAGYFAPVSVVAVVGEDFRPEDLDLLGRRRVDISGLERRSGKSFRWSGAYSAEDVNERTTLDTQLNVFADFSPTLSPSQRRSPYVFLANIDPDLQLQVLEQMESKPRFVALDTMNFWIEGKKSSLRRVVSKIDALFVDEAEVREFSGEANVVKATRRVMDLGPTVVIVKRGDHGVIVFDGESAFAAPAFPLESVVDPTGAGDSFAGGFMGYLAATGDLTAGALRRATVLGSVMGSFAVESFSVDRLSSLAEADIESRFRALTDLSRFDALADDETLPWGAGS